MSIKNDPAVYPQGPSGAVDYDQAQQFFLMHHPEALGGAVMSMGTPWHSFYNGIAHAENAQPNEEGQVNMKLGGSVGQAPLPEMGSVSDFASPTYNPQNDPTSIHFLRQAATAPATPGASTAPVAGGLAALKKAKNNNGV